MQQRRHVPKWLKWEFWPYWFFYIPVYFLIVVDAFRARTLAFFTLANPGMEMGGFSGYSKYDILRQLHPKYLPKTILFEAAPVAETIDQKMKEAGISFPIILKPDEGERGWKVEKIDNSIELAQYLVDGPAKCMLQEYIDLPEEYGIMYYRYPGEETGHISSVMKREFLTVKGDGYATLLRLFQQSERCRYYMDRLKLKFAGQLDSVPADGEVRILEEIGNHNRGTMFLDANHLINEKLVKTFDEAGSTLKEWYFGRYDVRTSSYEEMIAGNFKVIEINGVNSEPTHIYDPDMSIFKAYRDLFAHWNIIFRISRLNRKRGLKPASMRALYKNIRSHLREKKLHPNKF